MVTSTDCLLINVLSNLIGAHHVHVVAGATLFMIAACWPSSFPLAVNAAESPPAAVQQLGTESNNPLNQKQL